VVQTFGAVLVVTAVGMLQTHPPVIKKIMISSIASEKIE
jgi:hypothetical protein